MKSYTDIEQSKKLAEILPIESADEHYVRRVTDFMGNPVDGEWSHHKYGNPNSKYANYIVQNFTSYEVIPCWSLAALLGVMPKGEGKDLSLVFGSYDGGYHPLWFCTYEETPTILEICAADNPIDACVEMIMKLHEQKLL